MALLQAKSIGTKQGSMYDVRRGATRGGPYFGALSKIGRRRVSPGRRNAGLARPRSYRGRGAREETNPVQGVIDKQQKHKYCVPWS